MNFVFRSNRISVLLTKIEKCFVLGTNIKHNVYVALSSITDTKTGNPVIWMLVFQDREVINALWKVPEGMVFILLAFPISITGFGI